MSTRKGGLGRGLDSLIPTSLSEPITTNTGVTIADQGEVDINAIVPNPKQPRTIFDTEALAELSASIKEVGVLQPPVVRDIGGGKYELIMGERRLRASKLAGLKTIPLVFGPQVQQQIHSMYQTLNVLTEESMVKTTSYPQIK